MKLIELMAVGKQTLTPKEFVALSEEDRSNIKSAKIIPPRIGTKSFGKIEITLKYPIYAPK